MASTGPLAAVCGTVAHRALSGRNGIERDGRSAANLVRDHVQRTTIEVPLIG